MTKKTKAGLRIALYGLPLLLIVSIVIAILISVISGVNRINNVDKENSAQQVRAYNQQLEREKNHDIKYFKQSRNVIIKDMNLKIQNEKYNDVIAIANKYVKYKGKDENITKIIKEVFGKRKAKQKCAKIADYIKTLRYITAHNNNDQLKYEMDRLKTAEELKKFELNKCDNSLLSDNSWNNKKIG